MAVIYCEMILTCFRDGSACLAMADDGKKRIPLRRLPSGVDEFAYRNGQVVHRANECVRAVELLRALNDGTAPNNHWSSKFDPLSMRGRLSMDRLAIAGT